MNGRYKSWSRTRSIYTTALPKISIILGLVLNRKYKILRYTYTIFMVGIIISVIAFAVAFNYFGPERAG